MIRIKKNDSEAKRKPMTPENALMRLEALCASGERCIYEITTRLYRWGIVGAEADKIVDLLIDNRFVDERRFAKAFVNDKLFFSGHGRLKLRMGLMAKRVAKNVIDEALAGIDEDEYYDKLVAVLRVKAAHIADLETYEGRTKLFRFGASRGFESALVAKAIREKRYLPE